jgi:hypothetical protein
MSATHGGLQKAGGRAQRAGLDDLQNGSFMPGGNAMPAVSLPIFS